MICKPPLTSANVLFLEEGEGGESEGDLPGELAVGGGESVDNAAAGPLLAASFKSGGASHDGDQHDQDLHLRGWVEEHFLGRVEVLIWLLSQSRFYINRLDENETIAGGSDRSIDLS